MNQQEQQIIETLATKVMEWELRGNYWQTTIEGSVHKDYLVEVWNPLHHISDSWMLVDKLRTGDYVVNVFAHGAGFNCEIHEVGTWVSSTEVDASTAQEAISMAVYAAVC